MTTHIADGSTLIADDNTHCRKQRILQMATHIADGSTLIADDNTYCR
jgi:hypothetical protein